MAASGKAQVVSACTVWHACLPLVHSEHNQYGAFVEGCNEGMYEKSGAAVTATLYTVVQILF